jgi:uncharacterized membrane protein YfcA
MLATHLPTSTIAIIFGVVLMYSAYVSSRERPEGVTHEPPDKLATKLRMDSDYPTKEGRVAYHVRRVPLGFALMYVAGVISGLLGIGSGSIKVLAMDQAMKLPFKVSTTTSNFMIGVTAAASAGIYLHRGYIVPSLAMPVMLGVLGGALLGARILPGAKVKTLRIVFGVVIAAVAVEMMLGSRTLSSGPPVAGWRLDGDGMGKAAACRRTLKGLCRADELRSLLNGKR